MHPVDLMRATMLTATTGQFVFPSSQAIKDKFNLAAVITSTTCAAGTVIALDAADFITATGDAPEFDVSNQATLHMESVPLPIATGAQGSGVLATPTRSLWQTDTIGVRMTLDVTWAMRRTGMVNFISAITW
jgi:hypothetical protein